MTTTYKPVSQACGRGQAAAESMAAAESILPPCGSQGLSGNQATQSQVLSTHAQLSEHIMFILDGFGRERPVPVGAYFPDRSMRNDQHDAVATQLLIPISRIRPWLQRPEGGAPQPAEAPSDAESDSDQDTPEQGVSEGQLCAVSIERVQGGARGGIPTFLLQHSRFQPFGQSPPSCIKIKS